MKDNNVLTTKELAEYLKLNEKTIIKMAQSGELPGFKIGSQWRFYLSIINEYLHDKALKSSNNLNLGKFVETTREIFPLSRLTDPSCINLDLKADRKDGILYELASVAVSAGVASSAEKVFEQLIKREEMLSTALGGGVAIPHSRNPNDELFKKPSVIIGRSVSGVDFSAPDGAKVHLFFMSCAPDVVMHLNLLAKIAKFLGSPGIFQKIMDAKTNDDIMKLLLKSERESFELLNQFSEFKSKQFRL